MRMELGLRGWLCALLLSIPLSVAATQRIYFDEQNPPFMYADDRTHAAVGLYPSLITEAFRRMAVDVELKTLPWRRALKELELGHAGLGGLYRSRERQEKYDYSEPLFEEQIAIYSLAANGKLFHELRDLEGKRVGVINGWYYSDDFSAALKSGRIKVQPVADDKTNMRKLQLGRLDAVLAITQSGDGVLHAMALDRVITRSQQPFLTNPVYLAFHRRAQQQALLQQFNQTLQAMRQDGTYGRLVQQGFANAEPPRPFVQMAWSEDPQTQATLRLSSEER